MTRGRGGVQRRHDRRRIWRRSSSRWTGSRPGPRRTGRSIRVRARDRGHRVSVVEPIAPRAAVAPGEPADVDSAARPHLCADDRRGARTSRTARRAGHLRRQSSEPLRRAGDPRFAAAAAGAIASRRRWRRSSSRRTSIPEQFGRKAWFTNSLNYYLAAFFFNAFPLPQREAGTRQTLRYIGDLIGGGYSVLIFPEGKRTQSGEIGRFQPGIGMIASRLESAGRPGPARGARPHPPSHARISHRRPWTLRLRCSMSLKGNDYAALATRVEAAVRAL